MVRTFVRGGCLAAALFLLGCGGPPAAKPVAVKPVVGKPPVSKATEKTKPAAAKRVEVAKPAAKEEPLPPVEIGPLLAVPADSPKGFEGKSLPEDSQIPPEVQQDLKSYDKEAYPKKIALLLHPHPKVREQAADALSYLSDDTKGLLPEVVKGLRGALKDSVAKVREEAADALQSYARGKEEPGSVEAAATALPELAALLSDPDRDVRQYAFWVLNELGPKAAPALPNLLTILKDPKHPSRESAIGVIGAIGPAAKSAVPMLAPMIGDTSYYGGGDDAAVALGAIGAEPVLFAAISSDDKGKISNAAKGIGRLKSPSEATVARLIAVAVPHSNASENAVISLGMIRPTTKAISDALVAATKDAESSVRGNALRALGECEPKFDDAIPALVAATSDAEKWVAGAATAALGRYQGSAEMRLKVVLDQYIREGDMYAGGKDEALAKGAEEFRPLLKKIVEDEKADEVHRAAALIAMIYTTGSKDGPEKDANKQEATALARPFIAKGVPATLRSAGATVVDAFTYGRDDAWDAAWVEGALHSKFLPGRRQAAALLAESKLPAAREALLKVLNESDAKLTEIAARNLALLGKDAAAAAPRLIQLASDPKIESRSNYVEALGAIAAKPELSVPFLQKLLKDEDSYVRYSALKSYAQIAAVNEVDVKHILAEVQEKLSDPKGYGHGAALEAVAILGPKGAAAVPKILEYLKTETDEYDRKSAAKALGAIGPAAAAAAPALIEGVATWKEPDEPLRALAKIKRGGPELAKLAPKLLQNIDQRGVVLETLAELGDEAKDSVPAVAEMLDSKEEHDRRRALETLNKIGAAAKSAADKIKKTAADDPDEGLRTLAAQTLLAVAPDDDRAVDAAFLEVAKSNRWQSEELRKRLAKSPESIAKGLESKEAEVRAAALKMVPDAFPPEKALALYEKAFADKDEKVRGAAALKLMDAGKNVPGLLELLVANLDDDETRNAIQSAGREAGPVLAKIVLDESKPAEQRREAARTMRGMHLPPRLQHKLLAGGLKSEDPETRFQAATALTNAGPHKGDVVKILLANLRSKDPAVVREALQIAAFHGRDADDVYLPEVAAAIVEIAAGPDEKMAEQASSILGYHKLPAGAASKAIQSLASHPDTIRRAANLVSRLQGGDPETAPLFSAALKKADDRNSYELVQALSKLGEPGRAALLETFADPKTSQRIRQTVLDQLFAVRKPTEADVAEVVPLLESPALAPYAAVLLGGWEYKGKPLQKQLLALLNSDDFRHQASNALHKRPDDVEAALPELLVMAGETSGRAWSHAFHLAAGAAADAPSKAKLVDLIASEADADRRSSMMHYLSSNDDAPTLTAIVDALAEAKGERFDRLLSVISEVSALEGERETVGKKLAPLAAKVSDAQKLPLALALARCKIADDAGVALLVAALADKETPNRYSYASALNALDEKAAPAVPALLKLLDDEQFDESAVELLGSIGPKAAPAVPQLVARLSNRRHFHAACNALGRIGPAAGAATPQLLAALDPPGGRGLTAMDSLKQIAPEKAVEAVHARLSDPKRRAQGVVLVQRLGQQARKELPAVLAALQQDDVDEKVSVLGALSALAWHGDRDEYDEPMKDLGPLPPADAKAIVAAAAPLVASKEEDLAQAAVSLLGTVHAEPEVSIPALLAALERKDGGVQSSAARSLAAFGAEGAKLVPTATKWLDDPQLQWTATEVLGKLGAASAPAVPALVKLAIGSDAGSDDSDSQYYRRSRAIEALGDIGPAAIAAAPELAKLYASMDKAVRRQAGAALWKIDPAAAEKAGVEPPKKSKKK